MALTLKYKIEDTRKVTEVYVTDQTGVYSSPDNEGGWGSPNPDLDQMALIVIARLKHSSGDIYLTSVTSQISHNSSAVNTDETVFTLEYENDGTHEFYLLAVHASTDGSTALDGHTLAESEYFYMNGAIYQIVSGSPVLVSDLSVMIDDTSVTQTLCDKFYVSKLKLERTDLYLDYTSARSGRCAEDPKFLKLRELSEDIIGAINTFLSGLKVEAESQVETLLDYYNVE